VQAHVARRELLDLGHGYEQTHESPRKSAHAKRRKTSLGSTRRTTKAESTPTEKISSRDTPDGPPENDGWSAEKRRTTKAESSTNQTSWLTTRRTVRQWTPDGPSNDGRQGQSTAQTKTAQLNTRWMVRRCTPDGPPSDAGLSGVRRTARTEKPLRDRVPKKMGKTQSKCLIKISKNYQSSTRELGTSSEKFSSKGASLLLRTVRRFTPDGPAFDSRQSSKRKSKTPTKIDSKIL